jgi:parvulin-like peptidyl-prolyl isomerase
MVKDTKTLGQTHDTSRTRILILAAVAVVVIGIIAFVAIYGSKRAPFRATVLEVDNASIKMDYFLKRIFLTRGDPGVVLQMLANEQIITQTATQPPYNIRITEEDIDQFLRDIASGEGQTSGEGEFKAWYRQELEQTRFTDAEYRYLVRNNLLRQGLTRYLVERIPTVAEQVHLFIIIQQTTEDALVVRQRLEEGEDFITLARELNIDEELKEQGGDLGWLPRIALAENLARVAFDELDVGQHSEPLVVSQQFVAIIMVAEKAAARQIDEQMFQNLKANILERWLQQELPYHRVVVHGLNNGYDAETEAWIQWQLQKMRE